MAVENLGDAIRSLRPDEQDSVRQFVEFLKRRGQSLASPFLAAVDEFIDQHWGDNWRESLSADSAKRTSAA